jgi:hypothetical protein
MSRCAAQETVAVQKTVFKHPRALRGAGQRQSISGQRISKSSFIYYSRSNTQSSMPWATE